jgi:sugar phosphate isomerase/epimerase
MLSLAAGVVLDVGPAESVTVAAAAGWPAAGIWFDPATWTDAVAADVLARLDGTGLVALDLEPVMLSTGGPSTDHGERIIDAALTIGARNVLVASRDADHWRVAARLAELAQRLGSSGIRLCLEFLPALGVKTLADAVRIVESVGHPALGVLVDSLHLARAGEGPGDAARIVAHRPGLLPYLQLADAAAEPPSRDVPGLITEALHGRLLPGEGVLPLRELLDAVPAVPVSVELRSKALMEAFPDATDRARAVLAATHLVVR